MKSRVCKYLAGVLFLFIIIGVDLNGQTRNDVIKAFNEGAQAAKTDVNAAISAFENVVVLADQVGETCNDLKDKASQILPGLYVRVATTAATEKKPAGEIIKASKVAAAVAEKYNSASNKENATKLLVQGYYNMGIEFFTDKDYDNAVLAFDSLLSINPEYTAAIYNKALIYRTQNNSTAFEETIDLFIEKVKSTNETEKLDQASGMALEYFRAAGSQANQAENLDEALAQLTKASKYGENKDLFYYFADVYNKQKKYDNGIEYAQKGLALETGDAEAKAKFYYQLAVGQAGKGQNSQACASFKNALYGAFAEASKAQRTNLKCQ